MYLSLSAGYSGAWVREKCANSLCGILSLSWGLFAEPCASVLLGLVFFRVYEHSDLSVPLVEVMCVV